MEIVTSTTEARVPVSIIRISGNIDSSTYQIFQTKAEELIAGGARHILVDMTAAPYISSAGLRALHSIFNQLRTLNKDTNTQGSSYLKVANLSREAREVFELGGFDTYIEVHDDIQKAIGSF